MGVKVRTRHDRSTDATCFRDEVRVRVEVPTPTTLSHRRTAANAPCRSPVPHSTLTASRRRCATLSVYRAGDPVATSPYLLASSRGADASGFRVMTADGSSPSLTCRWSVNGTLISSRPDGYPRLASRHFATVRIAGPCWGHAGRPAPDGDRQTADWFSPPPPTARAPSCARASALYHFDPTALSPPEVATRSSRLSTTGSPRSLSAFSSNPQVVGAARHPHPYGDGPEHDHGPTTCADRAPVAARRYGVALRRRLNAPRAAAHDACQLRGLNLRSSPARLPQGAVPRASSWTRTHSRRPRRLAAQARGSSRLPPVLAENETYAMVVTPAALQGTGFPRDIPRRGRLRPETAPRCAAEHRDLSGLLGSLLGVLGGPR